MSATVTGTGDYDPHPPGSEWEHVDDEGVLHKPTGADINRAADYYLKGVQAPGSTDKWSSAYPKGTAGLRQIESKDADGNLIKDADGKVVKVSSSA